MSQANSYIYPEIDNFFDDLNKEKAQSKFDYYKQKAFETE